MNKKILNLIIVSLSVVVSSLFLLTTTDKKMSDFFQRPLKSTEESSSVVMINIDDASVENIGTWPFNRDIYASALITMRELGAESAVFDLSFLDKSPAKVDENYVYNELPQYIQADFDRLKADQQSADDTLNSILTSVGYVVRPLDQILANELGFFNNSYLCFSLSEDKVSEEELDQMENFLPLKNIEVKGDTLTPEFSGALCALPELVAKTQGAGFVNADKDEDGYLRRLHPVLKFNGKYYGQLVLVPLLKRFGNPLVQISNSSIVLKDCKIDENTTRDIKIPRCRDGSVQIKYPRKQYVDYNATSLWNIYRIHLYEGFLKDVLSEMNENGFFDYFEGDNPFELWEACQYMHNEIVTNGEDAENEITFDSYMNYKNSFYSNVDLLLSGAAEQAILSESENDAELTQYVKDAFAVAKEYYNELKTARAELSEQLKGAICIFGTTATSTTDFGINQYEEGFPNPGVHYTFANMILSQDFVDDSAPWISILIAIILCLAYGLLSDKIRGTSRQIVLGIVMIAGTALLLFLYFAVTRRFIGFIAPVLSLALTFIATTVIGFMTASKDKKFITNAFSQCLSKEVVNEIVANPSSFKLGGQRLEMTAIFTDIQKFSSFSELLTASQLVSLLNYYLTRMSDIIMDERGTVDKYEGDAIIALVGAPVKMEDHAVRAVTAAIKMKAAEEEMNKEILQIASLDTKPSDMEEDLFDSFKILVSNGKKLFTRIGINSGEMIAGYMGSENKKNYTMMGNNVNLASRLEGVNKQYSTGGILCSEATAKLLDSSIVVRKLDRVRVVNVNTPIRLFEPVCFASDLTEDKKAYLSDWEEAMNLFESKDYEKANVLLEELNKKDPDDHVCSYYLSLLKDFFLKGRAPVAQDNIGVEYMDDGVFRLLQK